MVNTNIYNLFTIRKIIPYVHMCECEHVLSVYSEYTIELTEIIFLLFLNEKLLGITALFRVRCLKLYQVQLYMYVKIRILWIRIKDLPKYKSLQLPLRLRFQMIFTRERCWTMPTTGDGFVPSLFTQICKISWNSTLSNYAWSNIIWAKLFFIVYKIYFSSKASH